jgi:hypothetical protein
MSQYSKSLSVCQIKTIKVIDQVNRPRIVKAVRHVLH